MQRPPGDQFEGQLAQLLAEMFAPDELYRFLRHKVSRELSDDLPLVVHAPKNQYASLAAEKLLSRGQVTRAFFDALAMQRPECAEEIEIVAQCYMLLPVGEIPVLGPSPVAMGTLSEQEQALAPPPVKPQPATNRHVLPLWLHHILFILILVGGLFLLIYPMVKGRERDTASTFAGTVIVFSYVLALVGPLPAGGIMRTLANVLRSKGKE
ncbi:MAG: hypothetical protein MJE77_19895 [Proteobacteria bacterium]|nr:hypothetical protein [Pseudomonadota bacterium]